MPSPQRIYRYVTDEQLDAIIAAAIERTTNGAFTALSGQGHSSSKEYLDPSVMLFEANYEKQVRLRAVTPQKVYQNLTNETDPFTIL